MERNATPSSFGWDFQINAAIVLMLENIKAIKSVRVEGKKEDIELLLENNENIYAQAKNAIKCKTIILYRITIFNAFQVKKIFV